MISDVYRRRLLRRMGNSLVAICFTGLIILPGCGGGSSGSSGGGSPAPAISSIGPNTAFEGTGAFTLTVSGTNFVASSSVQWNGSPRMTTFVSGTELQAAIMPPDVATAGTESVTVVNPGAKGGTSNSETFTVDNPGPIIGALNPSSILQGGSNFILTVSGGDFVPTSMVEWNGSSRPTTFISSGELQAQITSADIAVASSASITAFNPPPQGGTSPPRTFPINPNSGPGYNLAITSQPSNDLVWDSVNHVIYLSVPSAAVTNGNSIATLDPATAIIRSSQFAGSEPDALAISGDSSFLCVGLDGSNMVQRFTLPGLATDINYSLGSDPFNLQPFFALDLQVAPAAPHTTAVTLGLPDTFPAAIGGIVIYDDATPRPTAAPGFGPTLHLFDSLQWGADATALYAANNENSGLDFYTLSVNSTGIVFDNDYFEEFTQFGIRIHFDPSTKLVYSDDGLVVDPATGLQIGSFNASGLMVPDSALNAAFFIGQSQSQVESPNFTIESFDLTTFTPTGSIVLPNVSGNPLRLIRWGQNGLAFNTDAGEVYLIAGSFVAQAQHASKIPSVLVHKTWKTR
jgi:hypothetical protein